MSYVPFIAAIVLSYACHQPVIGGQEPAAPPPVYVVIRIATVEPLGMPYAEIKIEGQEPMVAQADGEKEFIAVVPIELADEARKARLEGLYISSFHPISADEKKGQVVFNDGARDRLAYVTAGAPKPYFHPVSGPSGVRMNRAFPMEEVEGEERDHEHHRGLWFAHGDVDGVDFWTEGPGRGTIRHDRTYDIMFGAVFAAFRCDSTWLDAEGRVRLRDERRFLYAPGAGDPMLDVEVRLIAGEKPVVLGDTKEGTMAFRLSEELRAKGPKATGVLVNSLGERGEDAWGHNAAWLDCSGSAIEAETGVWLEDAPAPREIQIGVAIFDHPQNLRHPTPWHARTYGLLAANPFGLHEFKKAPKGSGSFTIEPGKPLVLRYRFLFHRGDADNARIAERYAAYAADPRR